MVRTHFLFSKIPESRKEHSQTFPNEMKISICVYFIQTLNESCRAMADRQVLFTTQVHASGEMMEIFESLGLSCPDLTIGHSATVMMMILILVLPSFYETIVALDATSTKKNQHISVSVTHYF